MCLKEVLLAEPNIIVQQQLHYKLRDPLYTQQWYLNQNGGNQLALYSHISIGKAAVSIGNFLLDLSKVFLVKYPATDGVLITESGIFTKANHYEKCSLAIQWKQT